ncbi:hypothetical protein D3C85_1524720 [compost metagenome]
MNRKLWLESVQLSYGDEAAERCRVILDEADRNKEQAKREAEMERMVRDVSVFLPNSMYPGDIRLVCAAALDACYRKFEIVEEDV